MFQPLASVLTRLAVAVSRVVLSGRAQRRQRHSFDDSDHTERLLAHAVRTCHAADQRCRIFFDEWSPTSCKKWPKFVSPKVKGDSKSSKPC